WVILVHVGCLFSTHRTSVGVRHHTQDVRGCPCVSMCVRQHTQDVRGCPSVHISARWSLKSAHWPFPRTVRVILAHVGCLFSTHRTSVSVRQHIQDVCVCPSAHTGRPWLTSVAVRVCPCVSVSTHRTSVAVHQYTYQHAVSVSTYRTSVCVRQHTQDVRGCLCVSDSTHMMSVAVQQYTYQHVGPWTQHTDPSRGLTLALPVDCLGDFGPRGLSVQYTHNVRGCPPAHTGRPWLSVCVRQHKRNVRGCPSVHISTRWSLDSARWPFPWTVWVILAHVGCLFSTHRTSVGFRQHTQDVCGCPWLSVSTHRTSVAVRVCLCVSGSTHRTSVALHQYTYQHAGPWTRLSGPSRGLFG
ncbi:unnamed protein product, partial [Brassica rapa]